MKYINIKAKDLTGFRDFLEKLDESTDTFMTKDEVRVFKRTKDISIYAGDKNISTQNITFIMNFIKEVLLWKS